VLLPLAAPAQKGGSVDAAALQRCLQVAGNASQEERRFAEEIQTALKTSATGQRILRAVVTDCPAKGPVTIQASGFKGSYIFNDRGVENISGVRGRGDDEHSPRVFYYNKLFLKFNDHPAGVSFASAVLAQEVARMIVRGYLKDSFEGYTDVLAFSLVEDEYARTKGYVVAYESSDEVTGATLEGADFSSNPQAFLDRLKLRYDYVLTLQQRELRDPINTYQRRIQDLNAAAEQQRKRGQEIPLLLDELDHALHSHPEKLGALAEPAGLLQERLLAELGALPAEKDETRQAIKNVTDMIAVLRGPIGQTTLKKLGDVSTDPVFARVMVDYDAELEALQALVKNKALRKPEQKNIPITEEKFREFFEKLHPGSPNPPWNDTPNSSSGGGPN
jgi:hypothetical protein